MLRTSTRSRILSMMLGALLLMTLSLGLGSIVCVAAERYQVAVVVMSVNSEYWLSVGAGAKAAAKDLGIDLIFRGPAVSSDFPGQVAIVEDMITRKVDAIVLAPCDMSALVPVVQKARAARIPVIQIDAPLNTTEVATFVGTDNEAAGELAADVLADLVGKKGEVALVNFVPGMGTAVARENGFRRGLEKYPDVKLVSVQYSRSDKAIAMQVTEDILTSHPNIAGIFAANNRSALGAAQAIRNRGLAGKVKFLAFDADPDEIQLLKDGVIDALIVQQPYKEGYLGVSMAFKAIKGEPIQKQVNLPTVVVTRDNMNTPEMQQVLYPEKLQQ